MFCVLSCWLGNPQKLLKTAHTHTHARARAHAHTHIHALKSLKTAHTHTHSCTSMRAHMHEPFRAWRKVVWLSLLVSCAAQLPAFTGINKGVILTCMKDTVEIAAFVFDIEYHNDSLVEGMLYLDSGVGQILILETQMGETYCRMPWCIPKDKEDLAS